MRMFVALIRAVFPAGRWEPGSSLYFRCPWCGQKLRYVPRKAGRSGPCPRCLRPCTTPQEPPPVENDGRGTFRVGRRATFSSRQSA